MQVDKLKPCPFCGGEAILSDRRYWQSPPFSICCKACNFDIWPHNSPSKAITAWNQRHSEGESLIESAERNAKLNNKSVLEMLELHIVDFPTPDNIYMQRLYIAALKESAKGVIRQLEVLKNVVRFADGRCWPEVQAAIDANQSILSHE